MKPIKIVIADDVVEMQEMVSKMLTLSNHPFEIVGTCSNGREVVEFASGNPVDMVLMDINMPEMNGLEATEALLDKNPNILVVMMSVQHESEYLKKAMLAGAKGYIMKPIDTDELIETLESTYLKYESQLKAALPKVEASYDGKIHTFYSGKGGVGKSFLSLSSAIVLAKKMSKKVLIIDMDLRFGDISLMLNKQNELTLKELFEEGNLTKIEDVQPFIHNIDDHLSCLFAPKDPTSAEYITADQIKGLMMLVKSYYDIIIVDTGVNFDDVTLSVLDLSDKVYLVSTIEVTSLKNTKTSLKVMQSLNYSKDKIKLIMNMTLDKFGVQKAQVEKAFSYDILAYVPEEVKLVRQSINSGIPLMDQKGQKFEKHIRALVEKMIA